MVAVAIMVLGLMGFRRLGSDLFPDVSFPAIAVTVPYPGASPAEVESLVSKPVEDAVIGINGIDRVRSFSREGSSLVFVLFNLGVDVTQAATEVRERVSQVRYKLPSETKEPLISRFDVSASPVLTYTLRGAGSSATVETLHAQVAEDRAILVAGRYGFYGQTNLERRRRSTCGTSATAAGPSTSRRSSCRGTSTT